MDSNKAFLPKIKAIIVRDDFIMSLSAVLGIDLAKQKFDVALFVNGKTRHKTCKNSAEGFEALKLWLEKQGIEKVHACLAVCRI